MKMTYFRMPMNVRKILELDINRDHQSYQAKVSSILTEHLAPKLKMYKRCVALATRYKIDPQELYLVAIDADHSGELSHLLPQIRPGIPVEEALNKLLTFGDAVAWVGMDDAGFPLCVYLTEPDARVNSQELPIKCGPEEE